MDTLNPQGHFKPRSLIEVLRSNKGETPTPGPAPAPAAVVPTPTPTPTPTPAPIDPSLIAPDPLPGPAPAPAVDPVPAPGPAPAVKNWYDGMSPDITANPIVQKYKTAEDQVKGHLELQSLMGNEKIALPKDANDAIAIARLNEALGVPKEATGENGYQLEAPAAPEGMEDMVFGIEKFKELMLARSVPQNMAKGLLEDYMGILTGIHTSGKEAYVASVNEAKAALTAKWGLAYDAKVKLGQNVMNKFAGTKENFDHINALIGADPIALEWLATIGGQFSEGSLGDLGSPAQGFTKTPAEAKTEYDAIMADSNDVYWAGVRNKNAVPEGVRVERIKYVESLLAMQLQGQPAPNQFPGSPGGKFDPAAPAPAA